MATQEQVNQIRTQVRTILLGYMVHVDSHIEGWLSQRDPVGFRTNRIQRRRARPRCRVRAQSLMRARIALILG